MSKTLEHRNRYRNNVALWRVKYLPVMSDGFADLSSITIHNYKNCEKKGCKRKSDHRHHKGHEYLFATLDEETYARRYIEFRSEDIVYLCKKCHKAIHRLYQKIIDELFLKINIVKSDLFDKERGRIKIILADFKFFNNEHLVMTREETIKHICDLYRLKLVKKCEDWLNRSLPNKRKKRKK